MISAKRQEAHSPARSDGVAAMNDPITAQIHDEVSAWDGVSVEPHRFGGIEFRVGRRELGHLHGASLADLPFPMAMREELIAAARVEPHHVLPNTGWVSRRIRTVRDAQDVIELFRLNYDRPWFRERQEALDARSIALLTGGRR